MQVNALGCQGNRLSVAQCDGEVPQRLMSAFDVCPQPDEECADSCVQRIPGDQADDECSSGEEPLRKSGDDACNVLVVSLDDDAVLNVAGTAVNEGAHARFSQLRQ